MTWYFKASGQTLRVWDHTQDPASDDPVAIRSTSDGSGWSWTRDQGHPSVVYDVMRDETVEAIESADIERAIRTVLDGAFEQIERYEAVR